jgi:beta-glucosidase
MLLVSDNKVNGVPSCANRKLLTDLLRDEWGFQGYIVSDCIAIQQVHTTHFFANSLEEAAALSLEAGTDWDLCGGFTPYLTTAVQKGLVSEARVDVAVRRVLTSRFELGDFDPKANVPYRSINASIAGTIRKQIATRSFLRPLHLLVCMFSATVGTQHTYE